MLTQNANIFLRVERELRSAGVRDDADLRVNGLYVVVELLYLLFGYVVRLLLQRSELCVDLLLFLCGLLLELLLRRDVLQYSQLDLQLLRHLRIRELVVCEDLGSGLNVLLDLLHFGLVVLQLHSQVLEVRHYLL